MNTPLYLARRMGFKSASDRAASPGVIVGYAGVALAIIIMLLAISVVRGFKKEITEKLIGFNAQITVFAPENEETPSFTRGIRLTDSLRHELSAALPGADASLIIRQPAIFKTDADFQGIILKGLTPDAAAWQFYGDNIVEGHVPQDSDGSESVIISSAIASKLGVTAGDRLPTHFLDGQSVRTRRLTVTGIFDTHFHDFDNAMAFTPIAMLQKLTHTDSITGTAIELRGIPMESIESGAQHVRAAMAGVTDPSETPAAYNVNTLNETCAQYLNWLDLLDTNVVVIIIIMACVAAITLISSLFIIILERVSTIGLLKAIGATNGQIRRMFIYMAERLVIRGIVIGDIIALGFIWLQGHYHILPLDAEAYYLNYVPVDISWQAVVIVNITVVIISALVLILPSHIIARLSPTASLRYE